VRKRFEEERELLNAFGKLRDGGDCNLAGRVRRKK